MGKLELWIQSILAAFRVVASMFNSLEEKIQNSKPYIGTNGNWFIGITDTGINATGNKGEKGDTGARGLQRIPGNKGEEGDTGARSLQGLPAEKGEKGDTGARGLQGLPGEKGEKGDTGARGLQGLPGE